MRIFSWLSVVLVALLTSCNCMQMVDGGILDESTGKAVSGVVIRLVNDNTDLDNKNKRIGISSRKGTFRISQMSSGYLGCPEITLYFFKEGYLPTKIITESFTTQKVVKLTPVR
ncbi:MAG: hypothetical protein HRT72_03530 [Flavobacteriales bacterium]|nr:hypothetical protein [Flavobacteriales bacterium]